MCSQCHLFVKVFNVIEPTKSVSVPQWRQSSKSFIQLLRLFRSFIHVKNRVGWPVVQAFCQLSSSTILSVILKPLKDLTPCLSVNHFCALRLLPSKAQR
ncbi:hypothetical protein Plhal703r1_c06g0034561 [Plasmopara halstedii]